MIKQLSNNHLIKLSLREKCLYSEFFWSVFSHIRTQYGPEKLRLRTLSTQFFWLIIKDTNTKGKVGKIIFSGAFRSSSVRRCSLKKMFLKISQYSQDSTCTGVFFLIKLQAVATLLKIRLQ